MMFKVPFRHLYQSLTREAEPLEYIYYDVGIQQKLGPLVVELNTHPTQDSEELKENARQGRAVSGPAAASPQQVSRQIRNNTCEHDRVAACLPPSETSQESPLKPPAENMQERKFWEILFSLVKMTYSKASTIST